MSEPIEDVITRLEWKTAHTMPELPHQYCRRTKANEADWYTFQSAIKASPICELWKGRRQRYLHVGEYKYWDQPPHPLINQMKITDDKDRLRAEG